MNEEKEIRELRGKIEKLENKVDKMSDLLGNLVRELGVAQGQTLDDKVEDLQKSIEQMKPEISKINVDLRNVRSVQNYGEKDFTDIKKALAAIYKILEVLHEGETGRLPR